MSGACHRPTHASSLHPSPGGSLSLRAHGPRIGATREESALNRPWRRE